MNSLNRTDILNDSKNLIDYMAEKDNRLSNLIDLGSFFLVKLMRCKEYPEERIMELFDRGCFYG
jgi:hypothetical protein